MQVIAVYKVTEEIEKPLTVELVERLVISKTAEYLYSYHADVDYLVDAQEELKDAAVIIGFYINDVRLLNKQFNFINIHPIVIENLAQNNIEKADFRNVDGVKVADIMFPKNPV